MIVLVLCCLPRYNEGIGNGVGSRRLLSLGILKIPKQILTLFCPVKIFPIRIFPSAVIGSLESCMHALYHSTAQIHSQTNWVATSFDGRLTLGQFGFSLSRVHSRIKLDQHQKKGL